jgi:4'-phosphopantetheinyl transferase
MYSIREIHPEWELLQQLSDLPHMQADEVFILKTEALACNPDMTVLSAAEQHYVSRFHKEEDRKTKLSGKWLTRLALSVQTGESASLLPIERQSGGKPECLLLNSPCFNLSDSGTSILLGISFRKIGVDLELLRSLPDMAALLKEVFSPEEAAVITHSPDPEAAFFQYWVCREAQMKKEGKGFGDAAFLPSDDTQVCWYKETLAYQAIAFSSGQYRLRFFSYIAGKS